MEATLIGLVISALVPKILEVLKSRRWALFIQPYAPALNRGTAIVVSILTTLGVAIDWNPVAGVVTISGLLPDQVLRLGLTWVLNFATQEAVYRRFVNTPSSVPPAARRGGLYLVPLLLAVGLSASCAKGVPIALAGEKTVRTAVLTVSERVEPLVCNAEARKVLTAKPCLQLLDALEPAVELAIAYNTALLQGKVPDLLKTIAALDRLIDAVKAVVPAGQAKDAALQDLVLARVRAEGGK